MKKIRLVLKIIALCSLIFAAFFNTSCITPAKTDSRGTESVLFLQLTGNTKQYAGDVVVTVDDGDSFTAKVNPAGMRAVKNEYSYKIATGAHSISVFYKGETILTKKIFGSAGEVKIVELP